MNNIHEAVKMAEKKLEYELNKTVAELENLTQMDIYAVNINHFNKDKFALSFSLRTNDNK